LLYPKFIGEARGGDVGAARQAKPIDPCLNLHQFVAGQLGDQGVLNFGVTRQDHKRLNSLSIADKLCGSRHGQSENCSTIFAETRAVGRPMVAHQPFQNGLGLGNLFLDFALCHRAQLRRSFCNGDWRKPFDGLVADQMGMEFGEKDCLLRHG